MGIVIRIINNSLTSVHSVVHLDNSPLKDHRGRGHQTDDSVGQKVGTVIFSLSFRIKNLYEED